MDFLINLDSPAVKKVVKYSTRSPLIPSASTSNTDSPSNNNPFDAVTNIIGRNQQPHDPFDIVLQASLKGNSIVHPEGLAKQNTKLNETFDKDPELIKQKKSLSTSLTEESSPNLSKISNIREFVSKRISSCIQRTINTSLSQVDLTKSLNNSPIKFRRSFSAGMLRTSANSGDFQVNSEELNISAPLNVTHTLYTDTTPNNDGTFTYEKSSPDLNDQSDNEASFDGIILRDEAIKLVKLIGKVELSSRQAVEETGNSLVGSEDLLDIRPPWETEDILTDEEQDSIGLPRLKTYRYNVTGLSNVIEEETVKKYIKRRSTDWGQPEETTHLCQDITKQTAETFSPETLSLVEDFPRKELPTVQIESNLMNEIPNKNQLRFKKKTGSEVPKKGPLKAFVPMQKMSKNLTTKLSQLKAKPQQQFTTDNKDETIAENNIRPVAASTPTKSKSAIGLGCLANKKEHENQKLSPTGRKIFRRSSSVEVVDRNQRNDRSSIQKVSTQKVIETNVQGGKKSHSRPQSAPETVFGKTVGNISRAALKALESRSLHRGGKIPKMKNPVALSAQDKENQAIVKK